MATAPAAAGATRPRRRFDPRDLGADVVPLGGLACRVVRPGKPGRRLEGVNERVLVLRVDEHAGVGRHELGRPADTGRDDRSAARHRLERGEAERLDEARLTDDIRRAEPVRDRVVGDRADGRHAGSTRERVAERAVADECQVTLAASFERARETEHVLALGQPSDADESRAGRLPIHRRPRLARRSRCEPSQVDAAVDHLHASACLRDDGFKPRSEPVRDRDDAGRAADGESGRSADDARALGVGHVLPVRGEDGGRASGEGGEQPGGDEEVRVDDVGPEAPRGRRDVVRERRVARQRPPRRSTTARARSCPRAARPASSSATNVPRSGASGPGYICETSRMRTVSDTVFRQG